MRQFIFLTLLSVALFQTTFLHAQCLAAKSSRGKINLSVVKLNKKNVCPSGTVPVSNILKDLTLPTGPQGPQGPQGSAGADAAGFPSSIPSGTTIRGLFSIRDDNADYARNMSGTVSFDALAPIAVADDKVIIKATQAVLTACGGNNTCLALDDRNNQNLCTGTADSPSAPAGYVCIYPLVATGISNSLQGYSYAQSRYGFQIFWAATAGLSVVGGNWAYTAP